MTGTKAPSPLRSAGALQKQIIIIGSGHNALVTAAYLAKAGCKPLVLEHRAAAGGECAAEEFHPGFRSSLASTTGPFLPDVVKALQLERYGLEFIKPAFQVCAPNLNGPSIFVYDDPKRTAQELANVSQKDAARFPEFVATFERIGKALRPLVTMTPPNIDAPTKAEMWTLGKLGWAVRGLGKRDEYRLLRYGPMAIADLAAEWFENETLRAIVAAGGIFGAFAGPWSAGTSAALLLQAAASGHAIRPAIFVKGGMGALAQALAKAATNAGAEIRTNAEVTEIRVTDGRVSSVVLKSGEEIPAWTCISEHDPGTTLIELMDPGELDPGFRNMIQNYRTLGTVARVDVALARLPKFEGIRCPDGDCATWLSGRVHIGPEIDYLERAFDAAKYGDFSPRPYLEISIPTLTDPSLARAGAHVMSIHAQFAPYNLKTGDWDSPREELADTIVNTIAEYAPNLKELIIARKVLTPVDLEREYRLRGGHIHQGEMALDQLFAFRPVIGWAQYRTPIKGLYLCGAGTHPGGGVTGAPGFNASREVIKDLRVRNRR
jgi:phytoene dehydrogenase-like protein